MARTPAKSAGPEEFVLLESNDGYSFVVSRNVAEGSGVLKSMLDPEGEFSRTEDGRWVARTMLTIGAFEEAKNKRARLDLRCALHLLRGISAR